MSSQHQSSLVLESSLRAGFGYAAATLLFVSSGVLLVSGGYWWGWFVGILPGTGCLCLLFFRISSFSTLTLTSGGFTYKCSSFAFSHRWTDIERFWVTGGTLRPYICFSIHPHSRTKVPNATYAFDRARVAAECSVVLDDYGYGARGLCDLLNEWRIQHGERPSGPQSGRWSAPILKA